MIEKLDDFFAESDFDSMDWADGGESEIAQEILEKLSPEEWLALGPMCGVRDRNWRGCLNSILHPAQGAVAVGLMLDLAFDPDEEVAFLAMDSLVFYTGSLGPAPDSPFLDLAMVPFPELLFAAQVRAGLMEQIRRVMEGCSDHNQKNLAALLRLLVKQPDPLADEKIA